MAYTPEQICLLHCTVMFYCTSPMGDIWTPHCCTNQSKINYFYHNTTQKCTTNIYAPPVPYVSHISKLLDMQLWGEYSNICSIYELTYINHVIRCAGHRWQWCWCQQWWRCQCQQQWWHCNPNTLPTWAIDQTNQNDRHITFEKKQCQVQCILYKELFEETSSSGEEDISKGEIRGKYVIPKIYTNRTNEASIWEDESEEHHFRQNEWNHWFNNTLQRTANNKSSLNFKKKINKYCKNQNFVLKKWTLVKDRRMEDTLCKIFGKTFTNRDIFVMKMD